MKTVNKFVFLSFLIISMTFSAASAFAKDKGHAPGTGSPVHGFEQGNKKGWKGEAVPPGWPHAAEKGWEKPDLTPNPPLPKVKKEL